MKRYICKNCQWKGSENELEYDTLDTCFGDDKIEMCPECGSYDVRIMAEEDKPKD